MPEAASQMRAVPSAEAVTICLPLGLQAALLTSSVWPVRLRSAVPEAESQMRAVSSAEAVTICLPSGLQAALET